MDPPTAGATNLNTTASVTTRPKGGDPDAIKRAQEAFEWQRQANVYYAVGLNILFFSVVLLRALYVRLSKRKWKLPTWATSFYSPHHHARAYHILKFPILAITIPTAPQALGITISSILLVCCSCFTYSSHIFAPNPFFHSILSQWLRHGANRTGVLSFACFPPMLLAVARKNMLVEATRWSYDSWNIFHRFLGRASLLLAAVHTALYFGYAWERADDFSKLFQATYWNAGVAACVAMCWLAGPPSIRWARARNYEFFLFVHVVMTIVFLYVCFVHIFWIFSVEWLWAACTCWVVDRLIRLWSSQWVAKGATTLVQGDVVRLTIPVEAGKALLNTPGQFVYLRFPTLSWFQKHPFSIAGVRAVGSVEVDQGVEEVEEIEEIEESLLEQGQEALPLIKGKKVQQLELVFTIRPFRGATKALHALGNGNVPVCVEGAYKHHIPLPRDTIFFAAGVGFALVLGYLRARKDGGRAYWAVGKAEDMWAFEELLAECEDGELDGLVVNYSGVRTEEADRLQRMGITVVRRRLRIQEVLEEWDEEWTKGEKRERAVMACGPERFLDELRVCVDAMEDVEYWEEVSTK